jgi:ABC-2 type transport system permease protein
MLGSVWGRAMREQVAPALLWGTLLGSLSAIFVSTIKEGLEPLRKITLDNPGWLTQVFGALTTPEAYLQVGLLLYTQVVPVIFGITQVMSWADDEAEGRLELQMALPRPRHKEMLARFLAALLGLACIVTLGLLGTLGGAAAFGVQLDAGKVVLATYAAGLLGAVIATLGIAIATLLRRPGIAVGLMVGLVAAMYFYNLFSTLWDIPEAVRNLSIFHLYGQPLTAGLNGGNMAALIGISLVAALLAIAGLRRRDIAR